MSVKPLQLPQSVDYHVLHGDCLAVLPGLAAESVDAIVTDPPYGLAFMGKDWDHGVPGEHFWREALRVAKPGAHLLAFGGSRTVHRLAVAIEDAGWEIRDTIMWLYGSGFPKSKDASKAIDGMDATEEQERRRLQFTEWIRSTGLTAKQIDKATGTNMGGHYTTPASQPAIMTREHLEAVRHLLDYVPDWVERECDIRSIESKNMADREVIAERTMVQGGGSSLQIRMGDRREVEANITAPATPDAIRWAGWGTALKPAHEPIIVARKPLQGTVAANVVKWGTGAINVDGCRVGSAADMNPSDFDDSRRSAPKFSGTFNGGKDGQYRAGTGEVPAGRWPANVVHDGSEEVLMLFPNTGSSWRADKGNKRKGWHFEAPDTGGPRGSHDTGSAARFFYCAKASKADRDEGLEGFEAKQRGGNRPNSKDDTGKFPDHDHRIMGGNHHPTVKPTSLMRWLVRLVTPPGGVILDPFTGSGSTGKAAMLEGFRFIGIEQDAEYVEIARARIAFAVADKTFGLFDMPEYTEQAQAAD